MISVLVSPRSFQEKNSYLLFENMSDIKFGVFLILLLPFLLGPLACFLSELIWNYGSYTQLVELLGRVISPVTRPLPKQDNTNKEETRTDIHASSEIPTHDPSVQAG
jgi:hypothetical protein